MSSFQSERRKHHPAPQSLNQPSTFVPAPSVAEHDAPAQQGQASVGSGYSLADLSIHAPAPQPTAMQLQKSERVDSQEQAESAPAGQQENQTGLPDALKAGVEQLSGYSLDSIRVHYNSSRPAEVQALAYTQGTEIHVGPGQEQHLPHEAWHVVQQMQGRVQPTMQMKGAAINDDEGLEREADVMGKRAIRMNPADPDSSTEDQSKPLLSTFAMQLMPKRRRSESSDSESSEDESSESESSDSEDEDWDPADFAADPMEADDILKSEVRASLSFNQQAKAWMKLDTPKNATGTYVCHICKQPIVKGQSVDQDHLPPWKDRLTAFITDKGLTVEDTDELTGALMKGLYNMRGSVFAHSACNRSHKGEDNYKPKWGTALKWYQAGGGAPFV